MGNGISFGSDIIVTVQTGDRKAAGTNAPVWFAAWDEKDNVSDKIQLNQIFESNFQRGKKDVFELPRRKFSNITCPLDKIEIWREYTGLTSTWFLDTVTVEDPDYNVIYTFPVFRWIRPNYSYVIQLYDTSLPFDDVRSEQRELELEEAKRIYKLSDSQPKLPVQVAQVPADEAYPEDFKRENAAELVKERVKQLKTDCWTHLRDIPSIYTGDELYMPQCKGLWEEDWFFGHQRMNGVNPGLIRLCTEIPSKLAVTDSMLKPLLEGHSVKSAMKNKKLFICDIDIFQGYHCPSEETTICSPILLLYLNRKNLLVPLAIQLFQEPSDSNPVFLPSDDKYIWLLAKMWYNNAEANHHMAVTFIGITCLMMESVGVSLHRQLSISHPLYKLMVPFFTNIMEENSDIVQNLLAEEGVIDQVMAIGASGVKKTIKKGLESWSLTVNSCLPADFVRRGVSQHLPSYYYRNDAMLVYYAIQNFVTKYIALYYETPESVEKDTELQNWVKEMGTSREENGMGIQGLTGNGSLCRPEQLQDLLSAIIFTCTAQRAASGAAQYDSYGFPPNYPLKLHGKPPADKTSRIEVDVLDALRKDTSWAEGVALAHVLSDTVNKGVLMEGSGQCLFDPRAVAVHYRFLDELDEIGKVIRERNSSRDFSYHYLIPSDI